MSNRAATPAATSRSTCTNSAVAGTSAETASGRFGTVATYTIRAPDGARPRRRRPLVDLSLDRRTHGAWAVIEVGGELDLYTAPSFRESVLEAAGGVEPSKV